MLGLMQDWPLTVDRILDHAKINHGHREVVTRSVEGPITRITYADMHSRAKQVSAALRGVGIGLGDRVATLAWNTGRHMECWYGAMGIGAVLHTVNPRLHPAQIAWILNHAGARILLVDVTFLPIIEAIAAHVPLLERVIALTDDGHLPPSGLPHFQSYESFIAGQGTDCAWGGFDENTACGLCYTSGTTGDPKGVLYSHRSNMLHSLIGLQRDVMGLSANDVILPVVPMFHANAWGIVFSAPAVGARIVMPGARMDGAAIHELLETEKVTFSAAVPTVWGMLLQHLESTGERLSTLKRVVIGGSAVPRGILETFEDKYGVEIIHAWGMTEMSPMGSLGTLPPEAEGATREERIAMKLKQGRAPFGVELKLVDDSGTELPRDGKNVGRLMARGPAVARGYFRLDAPILDEQGFFDTGDIATLDPVGFMQITDRAKDVIKSGGEWISSIDIENIAMSHPKAALAGVIGIAHPKWDERPLLLVKLRPGMDASGEEFIEFFTGKIAKWWTPDEVVFVDDIPLGATGKIDKKILRERFRDHRLKTA